MKKRLFLGLIAMTATALSLRADIIPTLSGVTTAGSNFSWNYATNVTVDEKVQPGDFFTIYDFGSIVAGTNVQPANWAFSSSLAGVTPSRVAPQDDPNVFNLTWTYTGTTEITGQALLGTFSALSQTNLLRSDNFAAHATRSTSPNVNTKIDNIGTVSVPVPEMSALAPIIGVCGFGMIGFARSLVRKRRAS